MLSSYCTNNGRSKLFVKLVKLSGFRLERPPKASTKAETAREVQIPHPRMPCGSPVKSPKTCQICQVSSDCSRFRVHNVHQSHQSASYASNLGRHDGCTKFCSKKLTWSALAEAAQSHMPPCSPADQPKSESEGKHVVPTWWTCHCSLSLRLQLALPTRPRPAV